MAIVRNAKIKSLGDGRAASLVSGRSAGTAPAKKSAGKHAAKKRAAKKQVGSKQDGKGTVHSISDAKARLHHEAEMGAAFHHMQRAGAVISLLEGGTGEDLTALLEHGIHIYRNAAENPKSIQCATGLLRAAEHLGMAGLYSARVEFRVEAAAATVKAVQHHMDTLRFRLDGLKTKKEREGLRLLKMARALLKRSQEIEDDRHLRYELVMAAEGICSALEAGL